MDQFWFEMDLFNKVMTFYPKLISFQKGADRMQWRLFKYVKTIIVDIQLCYFLLYVVRALQIRACNSDNIMEIMHYAYN